MKLTAYDFKVPNETKSNNFCRQYVDSAYSKKEHRAPDFCPHAPGICIGYPG